MKELRHSSHFVLRKTILICRKAELAFLVCFFFHQGIFFMIIMIHSAAEKGKVYLSNSYLPLPLTSQTLRR